MGKYGSVSYPVDGAVSPNLSKIKQRELPTN